MKRRGKGGEEGVEEGVEEDVEEGTEIRGGGMRGYGGRVWEIEEDV